MCTSRSTFWIPVAALAALLAFPALAYEDGVSESSSHGSSELGLAVQGALGNQIIVPDTPVMAQPTTTGTQAAGTGTGSTGQPGGLDAPPGAQATGQQPAGPTGPSNNPSTKTPEQMAYDREEMAKRVGYEIFRKDEDVKNDPLQRGTRWWSKRPLIRMSREQVQEMDEKYPYITANESAYGTLVPASVASMTEFTHMNDSELYTYFKYGTPDIPSNQPGEQGEPETLPTSENPRMCHQWRPKKEGKGKGNGIWSGVLEAGDLLESGLPPLALCSAAPSSSSSSSLRDRICACS